MVCGLGFGWFVLVGVEVFDVEQSKKPILQTCKLASSEKESQTTVSFFLSWGWMLAQKIYYEVVEWRCCCVDFLFIGMLDNNSHISLLSSKKSKPKDTRECLSVSTCSLTRS